MNVSCKTVQKKKKNVMLKSQLKLKDNQKKVDPIVNLNSCQMIH